MKVVIGSQCFLIFGAAFNGLIFANLLWSCASTFDCRYIWPTISYMACFRNHDKIFMLTLALTSAFLPVFFAFYAFHLSKHMETRFNFLYMFTGVLISLLVPFIGLFDEANLIEDIPSMEIHFDIMLAFTIAVLFWVYMTLSAISSIDKSKNRQSYIKMYQFTFSGMVLLSLSFVQWYYVKLGVNTWYINPTLEALLEWITVFMAGFLPYVYSRPFLSLQVSLKSPANFQKI